MDASQSSGDLPSRRSEYEMKQRQRAQDEEDRAVTWKLAAEALREAGGRLYPGSQPMGQLLGDPYRAACKTLGIDPDAWRGWLDALRAYEEAKVRDGDR